MDKFKEPLRLLSFAFQETNKTLVSDGKALFFSVVKTLGVGAVFVFLVFRFVEHEQVDGEIMMYVLGIASVFLAALFVYLVTFLWNLWLAPYRLSGTKVEELEARLCVAERAAGVTQKAMNREIQIERDARGKFEADFNRNLEPALLSAASKLTEDVRNSCHGTTTEGQQCITEIKALMRKLSIEIDRP